MKHAFLIIAHNEYPVLEVLLSMLDDERNDIYLHIDKRATELFQQIKKVKMQKAGFYLIDLKSATTRLYDTEAKIICIVSKKGAQCIECHHKDI